MKHSSLVSSFNHLLLHFTVDLVVNIWLAILNQKQSSSHGDILDHRLPPNSYNYIQCLLNTTITQGNLISDFHWAFDVNENNKTYEINSVTHNIGRILKGTTIVRSNERYGSVAYFKGDDSGIIIDNVTSYCYLNAGLCSNGLAFSFWINWERWKK